MHVATTIAPVQDGELTAQIHDDLAAIDLTPAEHAVDAAYISPTQIERAQRVHGITLLGPVVPDHSHQAKSGAGFDKAAFTIDWEHRRATCPQGTLSREWRPLRISGHGYIQVKFDKATCLACPVRPQCTDAVSGPRSLALLPTRELHEIQQHNRLDQRTEDWQRRYAIRAGIEATLSQNIRACGLRRTRYRGLPKTHVQHVLTALACNVTRIADWIADPARPRRPPSHFHAPPRGPFPGRGSRRTPRGRGDGPWHPRVDEGIEHCSLPAWGMDPLPGAARQHHVRARAGMDRTTDGWRTAGGQSSARCHECSAPCRSKSPVRGPPPDQTAPTTGPTPQAGRSRHSPGPLDAGIPPRQNYPRRSRRKETSSGASGMEVTVPVT